MIRSVALILTGLTGFSGLVYQVAWQRYLAVLVGSDAEATAVVLGIFLGGLSVGYAAFGRVAEILTSRASQSSVRSNLVFIYGSVEIGIGVYALLFPSFFVGVQRFSTFLPHSSEALSFATDVALTTVLVGPPSALMGATIPLLTQGLSRGLADATRVHAFVYASNTVGAFAGALAAGFFLIPKFGLHTCLLYMGLVNLFAGFVFAALSRIPPAAETLEPPVAGPTRAPARFHLFATVALLSGFAMMTLQTVLNRIGAMSLGSSHFTFSMVVAAFVLSIAIGSLAVSALPRVRPSYLILSQWLLVGILVAAQPYIEDAPYWAYVVRRDFFPGTDANFYPFHFRIFSWTLALLVVPVGLSGAALPLLFHHLRREVGDLGKIAGRLYAWNTLGSLVGALLGGYFLLFWFDLHHTYRFSVAALGIGAALLTGRILRFGWALGSIGLASILVLTATQSEWDSKKLTAGIYRGAPLYSYLKAGRSQYTETTWYGTKPVYYVDDPSVSVAIVEKIVQKVGTDEPGLAIVINGKSEGNIFGDYPTTGLLALLPAVLIGEPERAFVIGYGTGHTVGVLNTLDSIKETVVAEISPGVISAAKYFERYNFHAAADPKTTILRRDAYRALLRSDRLFDIIISEPTNPWVAGVETLFSREFLQAARGRLTSNGIYVQWFHTYEVDQATVTLVLDTFRQAFDRIAVWKSSPADLLILGFNDSDGSIDLQEIQTRFATPDFNAAFSGIKVSSFPNFLAHELIPEGALSAARPPASVHTIFHPILNDRAARAFFKGIQSELPAINDRVAAEEGMRNSLIRRYLASLPADQRGFAREQIILQRCAPVEPACMTLLASWTYAYPDDPEPRRILHELRHEALMEGRDLDLDPLSTVNLQRLGALYDPNGYLVQPDSYEAAKRMLDLFNGFYSHAAPFNSQTLHAMWERCAKTDERCSEALEQVRNTGVRPSQTRTMLGLP